MDSGPLVQANSSIVREMQPADLGRTSGPRVYPELSSQESAIRDYLRVLLKRKWTVLACLFTVFSVVAIASLKMTPVYEASGSIAINKPDSSLGNFNNSHNLQHRLLRPNRPRNRSKDSAERSSGPAGSEGSGPRPPA